MNYTSTFILKLSSEYKENVTNIFIFWPWIFNEDFIEMFFLFALGAMFKIKMKICILKKRNVYSQTDSTKLPSK